jgi:ribose transport system permease protein
MMTREEKADATDSPLARSWTVPWPLLGLLVILASFTILLDSQNQLGNFLSWPNLQAMLHQASVPALLALGMLVVIISGGIDLSVGRVVGLSTVCMMLVYNATRESTSSVAWASLAAVATGIGVGGLCGLVNGLSVTWLRVTPFVATLGMFGVAFGLGTWLARRPVPFPGTDHPEWVQALEQADHRYLMFDPGVWVTLIMAGVVLLLLRRTVFGRYVYAIGSNESAARLCGVPLTATRLGVYTLAGLLTGCAAVLVFARNNSGDARLGQGLELNVIAAVVVGGASLAGGHQCRAEEYSLRRHRRSQHGLAAMATPIDGLKAFFLFSTSRAGRNTTITHRDGCSKSWLTLPSRARRNRTRSSCSFAGMVT